MTTKVLLNVYDLSPSNDYLFPIGMGLHHTGVEITGREYSFASEGGIYESPPKQAPGARFRCQLELGTFDGGTQELHRALDELRHHGGFGSGASYNLVTKNCNHFCNALVHQLLRRPIPAHINRLANVGQCCSCLLPRELLGESPVGGTGNRGALQNGGRGGSSGGGLSAFQVPTRASMNRGTSMGAGAGVNAFLGRGHTLNGGSSSTSSSSSSSGQPDLTDRRERARKAALARMELQKSQAKES